MRQIVLSLLFLFVFAGVSLAQSDTTQTKTDIVKLYNGKSMVGTVVKVKTETIEFKESSTGLSYEIKKSEIAKIILESGKVLTFPDYVNNEEPTPKRTENHETDSGVGAGWIIAVSVGATLLLLILIGLLAGN